MSEFTILVSNAPDPAVWRRRDELVAATGIDPSSVERINLHVDEADRVLRAVSVMALFTERRVVVIDGFEQFPAGLFDDLASALAASDAAVIAVSSKAFPKHVVSKWGATVERLGAPQGRDVQRRVREVADRVGIRVNAGKFRDVADWAAFEDLLAQYAARGVAVLSDDDADDVAAAVGSGPKPWDVSDAIESGRAADAVRLVDAVDDAFPLMAYLAKRVLQMARVVESGAVSVQAVQDVAGVGSYPARKLLEAVKRLDAARVRRMVDVVADAEIRLRRDRDAGQVLAEAVVSLADIAAKR